MSNRLLIVENHPLVRRMTVAFLQRLPDVETCREVATVDQARRALDEEPADLVLVDLALEGESGLDLLSHIAEAGMRTRCMVVSGHHERRHVDRALDAGVHGYVLKGDPNELRVAVHKVLGGERFVSQRLLS